MRVNIDYLDGQGEMKIMLDLFSGCFGWSKAFADRGWHCIGIDLKEPENIPTNCTFIKRDILTLTPPQLRAMKPGFICASSPCEQFSVHGMKHFHPNPPHPTLGLQLFNHTREICEASGVPYVMENVRSAEKFVGLAVNHAGPFYLWGNAVPLFLPKGLKKGIRLGNGKVIKGMSAQQKHDYRLKFPEMQVGGESKGRAKFTAGWATIPDSLSNAVADYAESLLSIVGEKR